MRAAQSCSRHPRRQPTHRWLGEYCHSTWRSPIPSTVSLVNRYYDPVTAQFLSIDPLVASTGQPYQYAGDDPVNGSDPSGLDWAVGRGRVLPSGGDFPYRPPKGANDQPQKVRGTGSFVDNKGRTWTWDKLHDDHWDVANANGKGYTRVRPDGSILSSNATNIPCPTSVSGGVPPVSLPASWGFSPAPLTGSTPGVAALGALAALGGFVAANPEILAILAF